MEQLENNIELYQFYSMLTDLIFETSTGINLPLIELTSIVEAQDSFLGNSQKTDYEKAARMVYYVHYVTFMEKLLAGTNVRVN